MPSLQELLGIKPQQSLSDLLGIKQPSLEDLLGVASNASPDGQILPKTGLPE